MVDGPANDSDDISAGEYKKRYLVKIAETFYNIILNLDFLELILFLHMKTKYCIILYTYMYLGV